MYRTLCELDELSGVTVIVVDHHHYKITCVRLCVHITGGQKKPFDPTPNVLMKAHATELATSKNTRLLGRLRWTSRLSCGDP